MARIIGTAGSAPPAKPVKVKVKAHTRTAPAPPPQTPDSRDNNRAARAARPPKPVRARVRPSAPPQSPDSRDNNRTAREPKPIVHPSPDAQDVAGRSLEQQLYDAAYAHSVQDAARGHNAPLARELGMHPPRPKAKHGHGPSLNPLAVVHLPSAYVHALAHPDFGGLEVIPQAAKVVGRSAKDAEEMAVTLPSSVAHLGVTAATHPEKLPGELAAPYVQLYHHPVQSLSQHPLQTALMVAPAVRMPGRVLGRAARFTGRQTLTRPAATLPGTALRDARTGSRDVAVRALQARADRKHGAPEMTQADVQRRVDEFQHFSGEQRARVRRAAVKQVKERGLTGDDAQAHVSGALGRAKADLDRRFAQEFGAVHEITPQGHIVKPKGATLGVIHPSRTDAQRIADRLNARTVTIARGAAGPHMAIRAKVRVPLEFRVKEIGPDGAGGFAVVPKVAAETLRKHATVGSAGAPGSKIMRVAGKTFRSAVLPLSTRWLTGQAVEAALRSVVARAGPADWLRFQRVARELNRQYPGAGDELTMRVVHGGHFGLTGTAREFAQGDRTLADEFHGTAFEDVAHGLTKAGNTRPALAIRKGWQAYTNVVFNVVNGAIETTARKAMAGQAIRQGALMEHRLIGLSDRAIHDAARGLKGTESQVKLGRELDRMYGQYQKFSWQKRETLLHSSPFYPWYRAVVTFLLKTLPVDHPVTTALLADINAAEEDWRKAHGLSLLEPNHKPGFLLGSYPVGSGESAIRVGHYTPFAPGDAYGSVADLALPQFGDVKEILHGVDWRGRAVKGNRVLVAAKSLAEAHVPGLAQLDRITGLAGHYIDKTGEPTVAGGKNLPAALRREFDPLIATRPAGRSSGAQLPLPAGASPPVYVKPARLKPIGPYRGVAASPYSPVRVKPVRVKPR
jgi:hypothetical protein